MAGSRQSHVKRLMTGFRNWANSKPGVRLRGVVYALLHSLSHALMTEIALDCGYPASGLKERISCFGLARPIPETALNFGIPEQRADLSKPISFEMI